MNIVHKLTARHLKENKKRTVVTLIGIIISVAMITATCVSITSLFAMFAKDELYRAGNWHGKTLEATAQQIETLEDNQDLKYVSVCKKMTGDVYSFNLHNPSLSSLGIGEIGAANRDYFEAFVTANYSGAFPKNEKEIFVARSLIEKNKLDWKLGDSVSIDLGKRFVISEDGEKACTGGIYSVGEAFESTGEETFTIVGVVEPNPATESCPILRGFSETETGGADVYLTAQTLDRNSVDTLQNALRLAGCNLESLSIHNDLFRYNWIINEMDVLMATMINFGAIILTLIIIASVMLIYNAFGISISERSRYLGMLASVGATRRQKRTSVYYEGAILGALGIPLGFIAGLAGMAITFRAITPILKKSAINIASDSTLQLEFPWWILPIIAALSIITIAISASIPARRASRTTPIDALRQNNDVKVKAKRLHTPRIIRALFGYEGELAHKNLKRNGKKARVITSSLVLSVVLFLSVNTFCQMFQTANKMSSDVPYQLYVQVRATDEERFKEVLDTQENVHTYYGVKNYFFKGVQVDATHYTSAYRNIYESTGIPFFLSVVDDADFNALCTQQGLDYKSFYGKSDETPILLLNAADRTNTAPKVFRDSIVGTQLQGESALTVRGLVKYTDDSYCCKLSPAKSICGFIPKSEAQKRDDLSSDLSSIGIETDAHEALTADLARILETEGFEQGYVMDYIAQDQQMTATIQLMQVFIYGFITLMTLIAVANIFNTISTSIDLRRKEFAMLKSVGITPKGFRRMLQFESLLYGLKALVYGLPVSIAISFCMWSVLMDGNITIPFTLDWRIYLGVVVSVFLIVALSMAYSTSKVKKDSIVETLKSDIN